MALLPRLLVLFWLFPAALCTPPLERIRGVAPSKQGDYSAGISCQVGGTVTNLLLDRVNDDFCDCDDGRDEPGTAACSHLLSAYFYCEKSGVLSENIHTSRVHDGICDCCDGADEEVGGKVLCPNVCAAAADAFRKKAEQWLEVVETGYEKREAVVKKKVAEYFENEEKVETIAQKELAGLKLLKERVTIHKDREELAERKYRIKVSRQKQAESHKSKTTSPESSDAEGQADVEVLNFEGLDALQVANDHILENSAEDERAAEVLTSRKGSVKSLIELPDGTQLSLADYLRMDHNNQAPNRREGQRFAEEMRRNDFLGPLFNGGAEGRKKIGLYALRTIGIVISPVRAVVEIVLFCPRTLWDLLSSPEVMGSLVESLPNIPKLSHSIWFRQLGGGSVYHGYSSVMWGVWVVWDAPVYAFNYLFPKLDDELKLPLAESLRKVLNEINADIAKLEKEQKERHEAAKIDYGPDRAFFAFKNECLEKRIEKYVYKFCAFGKVKQDSTRLGKWADWAAATSQDSTITVDSDKVDYTKMQYSKGQRCYNGPDRSVLVHLQCGIDDEILSVDEPSTCVYEMVLRSPLACSSHVLAKAQEDVAFWTQGR